MSDLFWIYTDANADISSEALHAERVRVLPMTCIIDEEETVRVGGPDDLETRRYIYGEQAKRRRLSTSQVPPQEYRDAFEPHVKDGEAVLYIGLSSGLSATFGSACMAAKQLEEEYPEARIALCDSLSATGGMGLLIEEALAWRAAGKSLEETAAHLDTWRHCLEHWFTVDDLNHLFRNGRLSRSAALIGTALQIKPVLHVTPDGRLEANEKKRGRKQAERCLLQHYQQERDPQRPRIYVGYTADPAPAQAFFERLKEEVPDADAFLHEISPIIGAHTGPGCLAMIYASKEDRH